MAMESVTLLEILMVQLWAMEALMGTLLEKGWALPWAIQTVMLWAMQMGR